METNQTASSPESMPPDNGDRRFTVISGRQSGKAAALANMKAAEKEELRKLQTAIKDGELSFQVDQPTSPFHFQMKTCTLAIHQALQFYSAWNEMTKGQRHEAR